MPRWLPKVLKRIRELAAARAVRVTYKAEREALVLGLAPEDMLDMIAGLGAGDCAGRVASKATSEWMYVFKPYVARQTIYVKVVLRDDCVVVSFHEDKGGSYEEDE